MLGGEEGSEKEAGIVIAEGRVVIAHTYLYLIQPSLVRLII